MAAVLYQPLEQSLPVAHPLKLLSWVLLLLACLQDTLSTLTYRRRLEEESVVAISQWKGASVTS